MDRNVRVVELDGRKWRFKRTKMYTHVDVDWGRNELHFRWTNEEADELRTILDDWMMKELDRDLAPIVVRVV